MRASLTNDSMDLERNRPPGDENHADVYTLLLRHNHQASGVAFSIDGKEGVICLVTRIGNESVTEDALDDAMDVTDAQLSAVISLRYPVIYPVEKIGPSIKLNNPRLGVARALWSIPRRT